MSTNWRRKAEHEPVWNRGAAHLRCRGSLHGPRNGSTSPLRFAADQDHRIAARLAAGRLRARAIPSLAAGEQSERGNFYCYLPSPRGRREVRRRRSAGTVLADSSARGGLRVVRPGNGDLSRATRRICARVPRAQTHPALDPRFRSDREAPGKDQRGASWVG